MKYNNYLLIVLALVCSLSLLAFDYQRAYALSLTVYSNNGDSADAIVRCGDTILVADSANDDLQFYSASNPNTLLGEITSGGGGSTIGCSLDGSRAYVYDGSNLQEIDVVNIALLRILATGCDTSFTFLDVNGGLTAYCGTSAATDQLKTISLTSMGITYTSTTVDTGANACDDIASLWYNSATDTMFVTCVANDRVVAVVGYSTSGTPDAFATTAAVGTTPFAVAFNRADSNIAVCGNTGGINFYNYTASGPTITLWTNIAINCNNIQGLQFDFDTGWYIVLDQTNDDIAIIDAQSPSTNTRLTTSAITVSTKVQVYDIENLYIAPANSAVGQTNFYVLDATGIALGGGAGGLPPPTGGGIDCDLPENEFILACRIGGSGSLGGAGAFIIGTTNGTTGLVPIMCNVGLVDCEANPDVATNGAGYLIVGIAIAVWVGVMWVASRGDLSSIPTFLWFIGALLIVGAFTVAGVIDVVFFIVTIIFVCALAAAKAKGLLGGGF